jgi:formylglycine-generating enzyme required for sulfatase activity
MTKSKPKKQISPRVFPLIAAGLLLAAPLQVVWAQDDSEEDDGRRVRRLGDTVSEQQEYSLDFPTDLAAQQPAVETPNVTLPDAAQNEQLHNLLEDLAYNPGSQQIEADLNALLDNVEAQARSALGDGNLVLANQLLQVVGTLQPERPSVAEIGGQINRRRNINQLLTSGQTALQQDQFITPADESAAHFFSQVLELDAENAAAAAGLQQVQQALLEQALTTAGDLDFEGAEAIIVQAEQLPGSDADTVANARQQVQQIGADRAQSLQVSIGQSIDAGEFTDAEAQLNELIALGGNADQVERLRESLQDARVYGGFKPGQAFSDNFQDGGGQGPNMIVLPAGSFMMGSPDSEAERISNEGPQHRVTFNRGFAMGRTEITVGDFKRFVDFTGYRTEAERGGDSTVYDEDSGRLSKARATWREAYAGQRADDNEPVIHISWNDASRYVQWLSEMTGRRYRLPSEAEFEYAMRGGTQSVYWWGEGNPSDVVENLTGDRDMSRSRRRWNEAFEDYDDGFWGPAPVASFPANPFGLHDLNGNVKEWVQDCWHDTYVRAPDDGSAWINQGCMSRVIRGGDWTSTPAMSRSAFRITASPDTRGARVGFRVVRDL